LTTENSGDNSNSKLNSPIDIGPKEELGKKN